MKIIGPMAGTGARLRPFTYSKPKGFLKIAGKRVIDHILDLFLGISPPGTDLLFILGYQTRTITKHTLEKFGDHFNITFKNQDPKGYIGDIPYFGGLGQAILLSENWYKEHISSYESKNPDDFSLIFLSDMIPIDGFKGIFDTLIGNKIENAQKNNLADEFKDDDETAKLLNNLHENNNKLNGNEIDGVLGVMRVSKERASSYGIVQIDHKTNLIKNLVEKPNHYVSDLAIAGIYAFKPVAMKRLYKYLAEEVEKFSDKDGEAQLTPAIQKIIDDGFKISVFEYKQNEKILDLGNPDALLEGNKYLLKNCSTSYGGPVKNLSNSSISSPSFLGKNVIIENCVIGPNVSIGDNCQLKDCILRNCVIGESCHLEKIIMEDSIIGDFVVMDSLIKKNLIIGDRSNIRSSKNKIGEVT